MCFQSLFRVSFARWSLQRGIVVGGWGVGVGGVVERQSLYSRRRSFHPKL